MCKVDCQFPLCSGEWQCGSLESYANFLYGPISPCDDPSNYTTSVPFGECIYQGNQCVWSGESK